MQPSQKASISEEKTLRATRITGIIISKKKDRIMTDTKRDAIKENIIMRGAELIHANGFNNTGLNDILSVANVPKGSFYFYFKNKEDFGCAVIDYMGEFISKIFKSHLENLELKPIERLDSLLKFYIKYFKNNGFTLGCPIGNLSLELADLSTDARYHLKIAIDKLVSIIESCIKDAVKEGLIYEDLNTRETAEFIFQGFEGAILHLKILKSMEPLYTFRKCIYGYLRVQTPELILK